MSSICAHGWSKAPWESPAVNKYKMGSGGAEFESCLCPRIARSFLTSEIPFDHGGEMEEHYLPLLVYKVVVTTQ